MPCRDSAFFLVLQIQFEIPFGWEKNEIYSIKFMGNVALCDMGRTLYCLYNHKYGLFFILISVCILRLFFAKYLPVIMNVYVCNRAWC